MERFGIYLHYSSWLVNLPNQSLPYILADEGFEVWLGNIRGNTYSRSHTLLSADSRTYWLFSWDHFAKYDLPAMLNYISTKSGNDKV